MIRIANGQGFWGDSLEAPVEQVRRGPLDYLTLDYLAEVTMSILQKQRARDPKTGYARDFVDMIARVLPDLKERRIRVIANAGGVNPKACCDAVLEAARRQGIAVRVAMVAGDDIMGRLDDFLSARRRAEQHGDRRASLRHSRTGAQRQCLLRGVPRGAGAGAAARKSWSRDASPTRAWRWRR